jgi:cation/acetate symporter
VSDAPQSMKPRTAIAGRAGFAIACLALALVALFLLDRVGVAESLVLALGPVLLLFAIGLIGLLVRTTDFDSFFNAGRRVPARYAGLAGAALASCAFVVLAPPSLGASAAVSAALGVMLGLLGLAGWTGPLLRAAKAISVVDLLAMRFPSAVYRIALALAVAAASFALAAAGVETATQALQAAGVNRTWAAGLAGVGVAALAGPGGLSGVVWTGAATAVIAATALAAFVASLAMRGAALPWPVLGDSQAWEQALALTGAWTTGEAANAPLLVIATALGVMALAPWFGAALSVGHVRAARRAGVVAWLWTAAIGLVGAGALAAATLGVHAVVAGAKPDQLPAWVYAASGAGALDVCGKAASGPAQARAACAAQGAQTLSLKHFKLKAPLLLRAGAESLGLGPAARGLSVAAVAALGLISGAAGLFVFAVALTHDLPPRDRRRPALPSARLAAARYALVAAAGACAVLSARGAVDPRLGMGAAAALSAVFVWPSLALALWPRASARDAMAALGASAAASAAVLYWIGAGAWADAAFAAAAAAGAGLLAGVASSFLRRSEPEGQNFLHRAVYSGAEASPPKDGG